MDETTPDTVSGPQAGGYAPIIRCAVLRVWNGLLDVVYPPRCLVCGLEDRPALCDACRRAVIPLNAPFCDRCGVPVGAGMIVCDDCAMGRAPLFAWSEAVGAYSGALRTAIHRLKYESKGALAAPLGELAAEALARSTRLSAPDEPFDCIVPVPLHPSRLRARGFNQAERIARIVADRSGIPLETRGLVRARRTVSQTELHENARVLNVAGAFGVRAPMYFDGRRPLLIDDVITTMATVNECARVLTNAGARRVAVLSVARGL